MDKEKILLTLSSPSVGLLRLRNRVFVIDFFLYAFDKDGYTNVSEEDLHYKLADFLKHHEDEDDLDDASTELNDTIETIEEKAIRKIREWTDSGFLVNSSGEYSSVFYDLSHHTRKTLDWLSFLVEKDFIGSESKLENIFKTLQDLTERTNEDVGQRIKMLKQRIKDSEAEIQKLKEDGSASVLEPHQIQERFIQLTQSSRELLTDFSEIERNFKKIIQDIHDKHITMDHTKKEIFIYTFDALDELRESGQGKSFSSFWELFMRGEFRNSWETEAYTLYKALDEKGIDYHDKSLTLLASRLHARGRKVLEVNDKMAERLNYVVKDESNRNTESVGRIIKSIKSGLIGLRESEIKTGMGMSIIVEEHPVLNLPFERGLIVEKKKVVNYSLSAKLADDDFTNSKEIQNIIRENSKNKIYPKEIKESILRELEKKEHITLFEVIQGSGGITKGLSEVFVYLSVLSSFRHAFNPSKQQEISLDKDNSKSIRMPEIIITN